MKNFFKITGYVVAGILLCMYLAFLFILPNKIDLNPYKPQLQKLVKENSGLDIDFAKIKIITSPLLEAGIKTKNISIKLPDGSVLFHADSLKTKVFLPSMLWLSVRVSCAEIKNPVLNIDITQDGTKFKAAKVYEDIVNTRRKDKLEHPEKYIQTETQELPFDISKIKVFVPALKLINYKVFINDTSTTHNLKLNGDLLKIGYFNAKTAKLFTEAKFLSDNKTNITAKLDINTFLPDFKLPEQEEEDLEAVYEIPFVNPVEMYRTYNLKSDINSKLKIRKNKKIGIINAKGFLDIENTTLTLSNLQLPVSHFRLKAKGHKAKIDTNLFITDKEKLNLFGVIGYGQKPFFDLNLKSTKVHFDNLIKIIQGYLDSIHIKNDFGQMSAQGYFLANARAKTDFKKLESDGKIVIRGGKIFDKNLGLLFNNFKGNFIFDNNVFEIKDTGVLINERPLEISGKLSSNAIANFKIYGSDIPIVPLYKAFAPKEIKNSYTLTSGLASIDTKLTGEVKDIALKLNGGIKNFGIKDFNGNFVITNNDAQIKLSNVQGNICGEIVNSGFKTILPKLYSTITDEKLTAKISNEKIDIQPSAIKFNKNSTINIQGEVKNYLSSPAAKLKANGSIAASDLGILLGNIASPYYDKKGSLPLKAVFELKNKKMKFQTQVKADSKNYITPVNLTDYVGKYSILQLKALKHGSTLKIEKSGLYSKPAGSAFTDDLDKNMTGAGEVIGLRAIISNIDFQPFISLFKLTIPNNIQGNVYILPKSRFLLNGRLFAYGKPESPNIKGTFVATDIKIPEIYTKINRAVFDIGSRELRFMFSEIDANGSDFSLSAKSNWKILFDKQFYNVKIFSKYIDIEKLNALTEAITKNFPTPNPTGNTKIAQVDEIPLEILNGDIRFKQIKVDKLEILNTTSKIALLKSVLYLNSLKSKPLGGDVVGNVIVKLLTMDINAKLSGKNFNIEKVLYDVLEMKDALSGEMNFTSVLKLRGTSQEEQMRTLKGIVDFNIKNGQLGPFGKFENFLMAENIRENAFFSSTIGSLITNLVTFNTSRYNELYGHLVMKGEGDVEISPIKSQGDVMSLFIFGNMNILDNTAELKLRGKLASAFSDKLGPLANINPINLVKHTPGLNIALVKAFALFCEEVSEEEMKAIPQLGEGKSDENATKFQIRLKGDVRKPLKMIKSFKWLALDSQIESAKNFADTLPIPEAGEENFTVEELIKIREEQAQAKAAAEEAARIEEEKKPINRLKKMLKIKKDE